MRELATSKRFRSKMKLMMRHRRKHSRFCNCCNRAYPRGLTALLSMRNASASVRFSDRRASASGDKSCAMEPAALRRRNDPGAPPRGASVWCTAEDTER